MFVHDRAAEDKFVAEGFGVDRRDVMYNDFVLIGPKADPAKVAGGKDVAAALKAIAAAKAPFVSRGDKSGTHAAELRYFKDAGVDPNEGKGTWYRETGSGHGPGAQHRLVDERVHPRRSRHVARVQEPRRARASWSRATASCSTRTASCWSTRRSTRT